MGHVKEEKRKQQDTQCSPKSSYTSEQVESGGDIEKKNCPKCHEMEHAYQQAEEHMKDGKQQLEESAILIQEVTFEIA